MSVLALVYITFVGSMLIANDMALLTFLPLGYLVLSSTGKEKYMAFTFIMQNIAANLGGMLTPFGNPQNLYLYTKFEIDNLEFMRIMAPPFVVAIVLITVCCLIFVKKEALEVSEDSPLICDAGIRDKHEGREESHEVGDGSHYPRDSTATLEICPAVLDEPAE